MAVQFQKSRALTALSLTPLIDVVFLLLIFFLVATRFSEEERQMSVLLPEASAAEPLISQPKQLFVNVDDEGQFFIGGEQLSEGGVEQALRQAWSNNPGRQEVIIRGDRNAKWESIALVMNLCNKVNIRNYKVATADI